MKNKPTAVSLSAVVGGLLVALLVYFQNTATLKSRVVVQSTGKNSIFFGEKKPTNEGSENYQRQVKAIDDAWDNIDIGNSYYKVGRYEDAAKAYEKAYLIGEKAVSGFKLAETYEKLNRYDEATLLLNQMIEKHQLSEMGVQDAKEMISRLLAAKSQSSQTQPTKSE